MSTTPKKIKLTITTVIEYEPNFLEYFESHLGATEPPLEMDDITTAMVAEWDIESLRQGEILPIDLGWDEITYHWEEVDE